MILHEHNRKQAQDPLPMDRARLLARVFSRGAAEPTRSDVDVAWELLGDLRDRARWLVCSCRPEAPLLFPRRKQTRMELVRHPAQAHALECPFHAVRSVARGACASRGFEVVLRAKDLTCLLYTSPSPRD